jgi:hypothetical protein
MGDQVDRGPFQAGRAWETPPAGARRIHQTGCVHRTTRYARQQTDLPYPHSSSITADLVHRSLASRATDRDSAPT